MRNPRETVEKIETTLSEWQVFGRRAQLQSVMPTLDMLIQHKVGYGALAALLTRNGVEISSDALRQAMSRWRKKRTCLVSPTNDSGAGSTKNQQKSEELIGEPREVRPLIETKEVGDVETDPLRFKERLNSIRNEHIDLEALKRQARSS